MKQSARSMSLLPALLCLLLLAACRRPLPGTAPPFSGDHIPPAGPAASAGDGREDASSQPGGSSSLPGQVLLPPENLSSSSSSQEGPPEESAGPGPSEPPVPPSAPVQEPEPAPAVENTKLYVLMYHHFVPDGQCCNTWTLTASRFREDMEWLADHGYTTVLPSELTAGKALPEKAVMLTFDDGYRSNYEIAYPILREHQAKAVISVVTSYITEQKPSFLTWDMCREMVQSGLVEIGSHTDASHGDTGIQRQAGEKKADYQARIHSDIQTSIDLIQAELGSAPLLFAYPNGIKDSWAAGFIADRFPITLVTVAGCSDLSNGLYSLRRYNVCMEVPLSTVLPE